MQIIFYKGIKGNISDYLICLATLGRYSHCELRFSDGCCFSSSPRDNGTRFKNIDIDPTHWDIVNVDISLQKEAAIRMWCETKVNLPYDWKEILAFAVPFIKGSPDKWICSEICMAALHHVNLMERTSTQILSPVAFHKDVVARFKT